MPMKTADVTRNKISARSRMVVSWSKLAVRIVNKGGRDLARWCLHLIGNGVGGAKRDGLDRDFGRFMAKGSRRSLYSGRRCARRTTFNRAMRKVGGDHAQVLPLSPLGASVHAPNGESTYVTLERAPITAACCRLNAKMITTVSWIIAGPTVRGDKIRGL